MPLTSTLPAVLNIYNSHLISSSTYVQLSLFLLPSIPLYTQLAEGTLKTFDDDDNSNSNEGLPFTKHLLWVRHCTYTISLGNSTHKYSME